MKNKLAENILRYHEATKHTPHRFARSPGFLDWKNQPEPFRIYKGAPLIRLPFIKEGPGAAYPGLFERQGNEFQEFSIENIAGFLELSLGLSAWKSAGGESWALRINPSSGNLHPTEAHLILPPLSTGKAHCGVFHYNPFFHALEMRSLFSPKVWDDIIGHFKTEGFIIGLSSIFWRESWKYGERAFRYCNHDVGHAAACLSFAANLFGWKLSCLNAVSDDEIETLFGFKKTNWKKPDMEHPDLLFFAHKSGNEVVSRAFPNEIVSEFESFPFKGVPNPLSNEYVDWEAIDDAAESTRKPKTEDAKFNYCSRNFVENSVSDQKASNIIRQRRSARDYDGETSITRDQFISILDRTIARDNCAPFDMELGESSVHLFLFVHRVEGLDPGLYFLIRNERDFEDIKSKTDDIFLWEKPGNVPADLPLYLLKRCDFKYEAEMISCQQEIAGDGAFSLGMIAKFQENVEKAPYLYRRLFWEAGMIGQILYLEAEVYSVRGTGIGCFFDNMAHQVLGLDDNAYQSIYHFTIGGPFEDERLSTLPPYHHLNDK